MQTADMHACCPHDANMHAAQLSSTRLDCCYASHTSFWYLIAETSAPSGVLTPQPSLQLPAAVTSRTPSPPSHLDLSGAAAAVGGAAEHPEQLPIQERGLHHTDSGRSCATEGLAAALTASPSLRITPLQVCWEHARLAAAASCHLLAMLLKCCRCRIMPLWSSWCIDSSVDGGMCPVLCHTHLCIVCMHMVCMRGDLMGITCMHVEHAPPILASR